MYSTLNFELGVYNNMIYVLFGETKEGYMFVDASERVQTCTRMMLYRAPRDVEHQTRWKDYIKKGEVNTYNVKVAAKGQMRLELSIVGINESAIFNGDLKAELFGSKLDTNSTLIYSYTITNPHNKTTLAANLMFASASTFTTLTLKLSTSAQTVTINCYIEF